METTGIGFDRDSADRWEVGSHFEEVDPPGAQIPGPTPWRATFATCRGALSALIDTGIRESGWRTLYVPTYYCPDAYPTPGLPIEVRRYPCSPGTGSAHLDAGPGSVVLTVSYFGNRPISVPGATVILDVTHDPMAEWLPEIHADYLVASFRKSLPVPFGAGILGGSGLPMPNPEPLSRAGLEFIDARRRAMRAKSLFLSGESGDGSYYAAMVASEAESSGLERQAVDPVSQRRVVEMLGGPWRSTRIANHQRLTASILPTSRVAVLPGTYGAVLLMEDHRARESLRSWLIHHRVYPAVLWKQPARAGDHLGLEFSRRHLVIPTDFRYSQADMVRVAGVVNGWRLT